MTQKMTRRGFLTSGLAAAAFPGLSTQAHAETLNLNVLAKYLKDMYRTPLGQKLIQERYRPLYNSPRPGHYNESALTAQFGQTLERFMRGDFDNKPYPEKLILLHCLYGNASNSFGAEAAITTGDEQQFHDAISKQFYNYFTILDSQIQTTNPSRLGHCSNTYRIFGVPRPY